MTPKFALYSREYTSLYNNKDYPRIVFVVINSSAITYAAKP